MTIEKYGVILKRLKRDNIELVRTWRNDPKIAQYMEFRGHISAEMQEQWFTKIDNDYNYYFIIEVQHEAIGVINMKDIDWSQGIGEHGIYIYHNQSTLKNIGSRSALAMFDHFFEKQGFNTILAHIIHDNQRSVDYHNMLGFQITDGQENINNQLYTLSKEDYTKNRDQVIKDLNIL